MSASMNARPSIDSPSRNPYRVGDDELGMGLHDVVRLDEGLDRELPVHRHTARVPPLGSQRLDLPCVERGRRGLEALPERGCVVVEVDPRTPTPDFATHGDEVEIGGLEVVFGERLSPWDVGVLAVRAVAPAVERAGETALTVSLSLREPHPTMAAGVLERLHISVVGAHHHDGLVEDLVFHEVARVRDLFEPAGHLPDP